MSEHCGRVTSHTKKRGKLHCCSWCGEAINLGERYAKWLYFNSGTRDTVYAHAECADEWAEESREWNEIIYATGDQDRPTTESEDITMTNEHTVTWDDIVNACIMDNCKSINVASDKRRLAIISADSELQALREEITRLKEESQWQRSG